MKIRLFAFLLLAVSGFAQTTHSVTLTWLDSLNPAGTTYSVYRASGLCSGTPSFAKLITGLSAKTFQDTTVTPGPFCYTVTAVVNGVESAQATPVNPTVPAFTPTGLGATVQ